MTKSKSKQQCESVHFKGYVIFLKPVFLIDAWKELTCFGAQMKAENMGAFKLGILASKVKLFWGHTGVEKIRRS